MTDTDKGIFINGKKQIIDMLQIMDKADKQRLLQLIQLRNPTMAKELADNSLSFQNIQDLDDEQLAQVFEFTSPTITGLALKLASRSFQKRVLTLINRQMAEKAYAVMINTTPRTTSECQRAQNKIVEIAVTLKKKNVIKFK